MFIAIVLTTLARELFNLVVIQLVVVNVVGSNIWGPNFGATSHRSTFLSFANDFEGNMICIGLGYVLEPTVQEDYEQQGLDMVQDPLFWDNFRISYL